MFDLQYEQEAITYEHTKEDAEIARQVAMLIFHNETLWEDWTHPNSTPLTCNEVSNAQEV